jgi:Transposase DDE domain group 1
MVDLYCESFRQVPKGITLDIDDTFDAVHGGQQLGLFNAHYDEYGFQPIVVFDGGGRFITAVLRPAKRPGGKEIKVFLGRLLRAIRANWPKTQIMLRGDSHYCAPEVLDFCRANGLDYILGVAPTTTLRRHVGDLEASVKARYEAAPNPGKARGFKEFYDGAASWSRVERVFARVEAGAEGPDTRFVVTNLKQRNPRTLYEDVYCRRGQAENHIKSWKTHLAADRTSCTKATANQFRLFLHAGAYWLMWGLRVSMPKRSMWRVAQFDTLRLRLIKIAARVVEMKTMIRVHLPTSCPAQDILRFALGRIPRLVT